jgi:hypothetical protein
MPSRIVLQERQRRGSLRRSARTGSCRARRRALEVAGRPSPPRSTRQQTALRSHILTCHRLSSIPSVLFFYTATLGPAGILHGDGRWRCGSSTIRKGWAFAASRSSSTPRPGRVGGSRWPFPHSGCNGTTSVALPHGCKIHPCHEAVAQYKYMMVYPRECPKPWKIGHPTQHQEAGDDEQDER